MNSMRRISVCFFMLVCCATPQTHLSDPDFNSLVARLQKKESRAVWEAAKSGDARLIPYLKPLLKDKQFQLSGDNIVVRATIARLGDEQTLHEYACEMSFGPDVAQYEAILESSGVGGWSSIRSMTEVLRRRKAPKDPFHYGRFYYLGDEAYAPANYYALERLPEIVPHPPFSGRVAGTAFDYSDEKAEGWIRWIDEHSAELRELKPNIEVDISSETCSRVLKNDSFIKHKMKW